jgi:hypothetical protein
VTVQPPENEGLSARECKATLYWGTQELVVADHAEQIDLDLFGADLKTAGPVAAFQVKKANDTCCVSYQIYSLKRPPELLRTLTGGSTFTASDKDLDGRIEIWTDDSAAVNGLDGLLVSEMNYPPAYVLRFEKTGVLDATREFREYFDDIVEHIRGQIKLDSLREFKLSDGRLHANLSSDFSQLHRLKIVKIQILEIVWAYLYSGREQEAWRNLAEMWPAGDVERIRSAITNARANGVLAQIDGVSSGGLATRKRKVWVYKQSEVTPAQPIYLWWPAPISPVDSSMLDHEFAVDLVIDSAGKVSSAVPVGERGSSAADIVSVVKAWKFIPGMKNGHSVASHLRLITSLKR